MKHTRDKCASCGVPWSDHSGIALTCERLERARLALRVIKTWVRCEPFLSADQLLKQCLRGLADYPEPKPKRKAKQ
jgi:hypothetical protein